MSIPRSNRPRGASNATLWAGFLEIEGRSECDLLPEGKGAYTNAVVLATDSEDFLGKVRMALEKVGPKLVKSTDIGRLLEDFDRNRQAIQALINLGSEATKTGEVEFTTWHVFDLDGPDR